MFVVLFSILITVQILNFKWISAEQYKESSRVISLAKTIASVGDVFGKTTS